MAFVGQVVNLRRIVNPPPSLRPYSQGASQSAADCNLHNAALQ